MVDKNKFNIQFRPDDYFGQFASLCNFLKILGKDELIKHIKENPVKPYDKFFSEKGYQAPEFDESKKVVLDKLVEDFNDVFISEEKINNYSNTDYDNFKKQIPEMIEDEFNQKQNKKDPDNREIFNIENFELNNYNTLLLYFSRKVEEQVSTNIRELNMLFEKN